MASPANPRDFFLQSVQTALTNAGQLNVLKVFNATENYNAPWVFVDLGMDENREGNDEGGHKVTKYAQEVLILLGFKIDAKDTASDGLLSAEGNKWIYHVQKALWAMLKTMGKYQDASCFVTVQRIRLVRVLDGYDNQELYGQSLLTAEINYTLTLL